MLNTSAQGTVADALKESMVRVSAQLGSAGAIVLNLHDELVLEVLESDAPDIASMVQREMEKAFARAIPGVPVKVEARLDSSLVG